MPPGTEREPGCSDKGPYGVEVSNSHRNPASQRPHQSLVLSVRRAIIPFSLISKSRVLAAHLDNSDLLVDREGLSWWLGHCP